MMNERKTTGAGRVMSRILTGSLALICLFSAGAEAGMPVISNQRVTDVSTRSFSVILSVSEPSTTILSLFAADCTTPATGFTSTLQQNATSGTMRITVSALAVATGYCYQLALTSSSTSEVTTTATAPVATMSAIVRTAPKGLNIVPVGNDIVKVPAVFLPPGATRDTIISTVELLDGSAASPLSRQLSNTLSADYFNLNNLYSSTTGATFVVNGVKRVKISELHGSSGCNIERFRTLPAASGGTAPRAFVQAIASDIDASGGVNILDVLRVVGGKGTTNSGSCFNSDLDFNGDGIIDAADLAIIKGGFNGLP
jgi:hypothetical protein